MRVAGTPLRIVVAVLALLLWALAASTVSAQPRCPPGARLAADGQHCVCAIGTHWQNGACVPDRCTAGFVRAADGRCVPLLPVPLIVCPQFSQWNGSQCVCAPGFRKLSNGSCVRAGPF